MATLNKKADISIPFILGLILLILVLVLLLYFVFSEYSPTLSGLVEQIWGGM